MLASLPALIEDVIAMSVSEFQPETRSATILAGDEATLLRLKRAVLAAGAEVAGTGTFTASDDPPALFGDILIADVRGLDGGRMALAFDQLAQSIAQAPQAIILTTLDNLDAVDSLCGPDADILVGGNDVDLHLALATALVRARGGKTALSDVASEEGLRLQRLADEIARIARTLIDLPDGLGGNGGNVSDAMISYRAAPPEGPDHLASAITAVEVRAIIRQRRLRDRYFPAELFADPAWDMLLDLAAARIERTRVAVSSLCIAAAVPPTTALRWIKAMTEKGLLRRVADPHDARRIFIQLSDDAAAAMERYLRTARSSGMAI